jgi:hypothetical protein
MNKSKMVFFAVLLVCAGTRVWSQNIGINSTGATPAVSAMLDVSSSDKGLLIPRVSLTAANQATPVSSPAASLLVYNQATSGSGSNKVVPGYYYWSGSSWVQLISGSTIGNASWALTGNAGTAASTNFIGTTDAVDFVLRSNNLERTRITSGGNVGIGTSTPDAKLDVEGSFKLGTNGTALSNLIKTTVSINDAVSFNYTATRQITVTLTGSEPNATVMLNPQTALPTGISVAWCRITTGNKLVIGFINSDVTSRSIGNVTFDVTLIQ